MVQMYMCANFMYTCMPLLCNIAIRDIKKHIFFPLKHDIGFTNFFRELNIQKTIKHLNIHGASATRALHLQYQSAALRTIKLVWIFMHGASYIDINMDKWPLPVV